MSTKTIFSTVGTVIVNISIVIVWIFSWIKFTEYFLSWNIPYINETAADAILSVITALVISAIITFICAMLLTALGMREAENSKKTKIHYKEEDIYKEGVFNSLIAAKIKKQKQ